MKSIGPGALGMATALIVNAILGLTAPECFVSAIIIVVGIHVAWWVDGRFQ